MRMRMRMRMRMNNEDDNDDVDNVNDADDADDDDDKDDDVGTVSQQAERPPWEAGHLVSSPALEEDLGGCDPLGAGDPATSGRRRAGDLGTENISTSGAGRQSGGGSGPILQLHLSSDGGECGQEGDRLRGGELHPTEECFLREIQREQVQGSRLDRPQVRPHPSGRRDPDQWLQPRHQARNVQTLRRASSNDDSELLGQFGRSEDDLSTTH